MYVFELSLLGVILECSKAVSHSNSGHSSVDGDGDNVAPNVRQPIKTGVNVLTEETSHRLLGETASRWKGGGRERKREGEKRDCVFKNHSYKNVVRTLHIAHQL